MFLQQSINGLTLGAVYALIALGYTMVYGILGLINFAHGEIYMLGAYLAIIMFGVLTALGITTYSLPLSILIVFISAGIFCGAYGLTVERIGYRPLRHAHRLSPLISAVGMSIFLQNYVMLAQGATDKISPYTIFTNSVTVFNASISYLQLFIFGLSLVLMVGLHLFIKKTRLGKAMRAASQDKRMAGLVGIDIDRIIAITFVIGSILAAAAGIMVSMYYGSVNFFVGYIAGIKAFTAAVLGGIGNIPGAMLGGIILGLIEGYTAGYISSEYKDIFAFAILIIVLIFMPTGLFGERISEKV